MVSDAFMELNVYIENRVKMVVAMMGYYTGDLMNKTSSTASYVGKTGIDELSNDKYDQKIVMNKDAAQFFTTNIDSINDGVHIIGNELKTVNKPYLDTHLFNSMNRNTENNQRAVPDMTDSPIQTPEVN
jgi:hypothetical protein